jgi:hypothetical protein
MSANVALSWVDGIDGDAFPDRTPERIRDVIEFEWRDVATPLDEAELDYHLAWRAVFHDGQPASAVARMNRRLAGAPDDLVALAMRAHAFRALGDCRSSVSDAKTASELLRQGAPSGRADLHGAIGGLLNADQCDPSRGR